MNHKHVLAIFLFFVIMIFSFVFKNPETEVVLKDVMSNVECFTIEKMVENTDNYSIEIYYPKTPYENVNQKIMDSIDIYKIRFLNSNFESDKKWLNISFEPYEYNGYISYKFMVKSNVGITHESEEIFTLVHKNEKVITLEELEKRNANIIEILCKECISLLENNDKVKEFANDNWNNSICKENKEAFSNFVLKPSGMCVIFNPYVVAPYSAGVIEIEIKYDKLNIIVD